MDEIPEQTEGLESQVEPEPATEVSPGLPWGGLITALGLILVVVFAVQNTETVPITFLWISGDFPLSIVILVTAVASAVLTAIGGAFYRRRRQQRRVDREELRRHREGP